MEKNAFTIELIWNEKRVSSKEWDRETFMKLMESIKDTFVANNEISKLFIDVIPEVDVITINNDRNRELDVPFITCKLHDGTQKHIRIPRSHHIIWGIFNECVS